MKCKICNNSTIKTNDFSFKCMTCKHIFINYTGDPIHYHKYEYRKNNHGTRSPNEINKNNLFTEKFHSDRKHICDERFKKIKDLLKSSDSLLDIGAGGGTFLNTVKNKIKIKDAQEINDVCILNLKNQNYKVYDGDFCSININSKYDIITCFHVLEHILDPHLFLSKILNITNKYLIIEVPISRTLQNPNINWDGHFHYFSKESIKKLFELKFNILSIEDGIQKPSLFVKLKLK